MKLLKKKKEVLYAIGFLARAAEEAEKSTCLRKKCGAVVVKNNEIIGRGYNSPPNNKLLDKCLKDNLSNNFKSDRTCCVHAEQRAIMDALKHYPYEVEGATLYFTRLDDDNNMTYSGKPYCTICSKMSLDAKLSRFVLWHDEGICVYNTDEYNEISFGRLAWNLGQ